MKKKILLSGATGFLGSHLLESFISKGYEVTILKRSKSNIVRINHLIGKFKSFNIDEYSLQEIFKVVNPEVVIHTACSYGRKNETTFDVINTNLIFSLELLKESERINVKTFINTDTLLPRKINDYSLSKAHFRDWLQSKSKNIQVINLKLEHIYGVNDDDSKFFPWLINKILNEEEEINLTSGIQKRDFIYVTDVVETFQILIEKAPELKNWNSFDIGTNHLYSVKEVVLKIANELERRSNKKIIGRLKFGTLEYRTGEVMSPKLDNTKIMKLGWLPKINLENGIELIINDLK